MKRFLWEDQGYALVLMLLFMPVFIGISLIVIDMARGNNAQSDLQAAADAIALAGAGELDGGPDAIDRAKAAMEKVANSVDFLGLDDGEGSIELNYSIGCANRPFNVIFLKEIPEFDYMPINKEWIDDEVNGRLPCIDPSAEEQSSAKYAYVSARSIDLNPMFPVPVSFTDEDIPVQAVAVAGRREAVCGITPLYVCNPFELEEGEVGYDLQTAFSKGQLHGRLVKIHPGGKDKASPGNFGFLTLDAKGKNALGNYLAGADSSLCVDGSAVETETGFKASVINDFNVRFDLFKKGNLAKDYSPAKNVRKGFKPIIVDGVESTDPCEVEWDETAVTDFPENLSGFTPGDGTSQTAGAYVGVGDWPADVYLDANFGTGVGRAFSIDDVPNSLDNFSDYDPSDDDNKNAKIPSRYDVYKYEIAQNRIEPTAETGEEGRPLCSSTKPNARERQPDDPDQRLIQIAVINCIENYAQGRKTFPVEGFASFFLTHPMIKNGPKVYDEFNNEVEMGTINGEIVDITGPGGLGTLDDFVRVESVLVR